MRSIIGPEIFLWYLAIDEELQTQDLFEPKFPHGHGFIARSIVICAGKLRVAFARETVITLSSNGCLKDSMTRFSNSANSSRKSTPLWAKVISPGFGYVPPPTSDTYEEVWCGFLNGRVLIISSSDFNAPAMECILVTSRASFFDSGGRMDANARASIVFPVPGGPIISALCEPAAAISRPRLADSCPRTS